MVVVEEVMVRLANRRSAHILKEETAKKEINVRCFTLHPPMLNLLSNHNKGNHSLNLEFAPIFKKEVVRKAPNARCFILNLSLKLLLNRPISLHCKRKVLLILSNNNKPSLLNENQEFVLTFKKAIVRRVPSVKCFTMPTSNLELLFNTKLRSPVLLKLDNLLQRHKLHSNLLNLKLPDL